VQRDCCYALGTLAVVPKPWHAHGTSCRFRRRSGAGQSPGQGGAITSGSGLARPSRPLQAGVRLGDQQHGATRLRRWHPAARLLVRRAGAGRRKGPGLADGPGPDTGLSVSFRFRAPSMIVDAGSPMWAAQVSGMAMQTATAGARHPRRHRAGHRCRGVTAATLRRRREPAGLAAGGRAAAGGEARRNWGRGSRRRFAPGWSSPPVAAARPVGGRAGPGPALPAGSATGAGQARRPPSAGRRRPPKAPQTSRGRSR
jgi:hypothetical protein